MNETIDPQIVYTAQEAVPVETVGDNLALVVLALALFLFGMFLGAMAGRPSVPRARVRLRALKSYLSSGDADDELVQSLLKRDIRSLENRLDLDADE